MYSDEFRNIDARTMKEFQAFITDQMGLQDYLCFPVYQFGKLKFIEGRLTKAITKQSKYNRKPHKAKVNDKVSG